jgi:hypothetical protein
MFLSLVCVFWGFCIVLFIVSPKVNSCFLQFYRLLHPAGKPNAVNKRHINLNKILFSTQEVGQNYDGAIPITFVLET